MRSTRGEEQEGEATRYAFSYLSLTPSLSLLSACREREGWSAYKVDGK